MRLEEGDQSGYSMMKKRDREMEDEIGEINRKLIGQDKEFGVYSKYRGKLQENFKQGSYIILFNF